MNWTELNCMKNIGRREAESDIFQTCSESNIFRFHSKEAIQYLHYYVSESDLNKCMKSKHSPPKWLKIPVPSSILSKQLLTVKIQQFNSLRSMVGKKGNLVMRFVGNLTTWREILTFDIKKYIRNGGKCNYVPGKSAFFQTLLRRQHFGAKQHWEP